MIWRARPVEARAPAPAGTIVERRAEGPVVACGDGALLLEEVETPRRARGRGGARMSRVLVIAAHPDDEVLGMGGTIALHAVVRKDAVRIVCVTDGSSTQYPGDAEIRAQKEEEARAAAAELGVTDYVHLDLPDMRLDTLPHVDVNRVVEEQIRDFEPDDRLHRAPRREPRPPRAVRLGRRRDAARAGPVGTPRARPTRRPRAPSGRPPASTGSSRTGSST